MKKPSIFVQLKSIVLLPFMVTVVIPFALIQYFGNHTLLSEPHSWLKIIGLVVFSVGFPLFLQSVNLFIQIGNGTLAPWDPTKNLVVVSLYRYMRNPMILGVLLILLSVSFFYNSLAVLCWFVLFFIINQVYFYFKEEPDLLKRFGEEYQEYCNNVPRWFPRLNGWRPEK